MAALTPADTLLKTRKATTAFLGLCLTARKRTISWRGGDSASGVNAASELIMADEDAGRMFLFLSAVVSHHVDGIRRGRTTRASRGVAARTGDVRGESQKRTEIELLVNFDWNRYLSRFIHRHASHFFSL